MYKVTLLIVTIVYICILSTKQPPHPTVYKEVKTPTPLYTLLSTVNKLTTVNKLLTYGSSSSNIFLKHTSINQTTKHPPQLHFLLLLSPTNNELHWNSNLPLTLKPKLPPPIEKTLSSIVYIIFTNTIEDHRQMATRHTKRPHNITPLTYNQRFGEPHKPSISSNYNIPLSNNKSHSGQTPHQIYPLWTQSLSLYFIDPSHRISFIVPNNQQKIHILNRTLKAYRSNSKEGWSHYWQLGKEYSSNIAGDGPPSTTASTRPFLPQVNQTIFVQWSTFPESRLPCWGGTDTHQLCVQGRYTQLVGNKWFVIFDALNTKDARGKTKFCKHLLGNDWIQRYGSNTSLGNWTLLRTADIHRQYNQTEEATYVQAETYETPLEFQLPREGGYLRDLDEQYELHETLVPPDSHMGVGTLNINSLKYDHLPHLAWFMIRHHLHTLTLQDTRTPTSQRPHLLASWKAHMGPSAHISFSQPSESPIHVGGQAILSSSNAGLRRTGNWEDPSGLGIIVEQRYDNQLTVLTVYYPASALDDGTNKLGAQLTRFLKDSQIDQTIDQYIWNQLTSRSRKAPTRQVVVTGDWNQRSHALKQKAEELGLLETPEHMEAYTYYVGDTPTSKIDHIWSSQERLGAGFWNHHLWQLISGHCGSGSPLTLKFTRKPSPTELRRTSPTPKKPQKHSRPRPL